MFLQWASKCVVFCNVSNSCRFKFILKLNCEPILVIEGLKSIVQFHFFLNNTGELYHFIKKKSLKHYKVAQGPKHPKNTDTTVPHTTKGNDPSRRNLVRLATPPTGCETGQELNCWLGTTSCPPAPLPGTLQQHTDGFP